ncbi:MAG: hypothetical protein WD407_08815 [Rhodospirillales bacterium]
MKRRPKQAVLVRTRRAGFYLLAPVMICIAVVAALFGMLGCWSLNLYVECEEWFKKQR